MFLQTKITMLPAGGFFGLQVCQKCFLWPGFAADPAGAAYSAPPDPIAAVCCYMAGLRQSPGKKLLESCDVLEKTWNCNQESGN